jgi:hypothetical protein
MRILASGKGRMTPINEVSLVGCMKKTGAASDHG